MISKIDYKGYAVAMSKNGRRPISYNRLERHIEMHCEIYRHNSAWIAGQIDENGIFIPSHVGYLRGRDILVLLKKLLDSEDKIILAVLENMGIQLQKIGWIYAGRIEVSYPHPQEKVVYVNHINMIPDWHWGLDDLEE